MGVCSYSNAITGVCGAWVDSIPTIFISGQVTSDTLIGETGLRQFGVQESNIIEMVKSITKYAVVVTDPSNIKYHLQKAIHLATTGRPGPVWLDIPLDIQSKLIDPEHLSSYEPFSDESMQEGNKIFKSQVIKCIEMLKNAKRPVIISGYGIRLSKAKKIFNELVEYMRIPVISSWTSSDLMADDNPLYVGRSGIIGDRAGNFTVQNSDLLLIIGSRMSIPQVGYNYKTFARAAKKIMVDIDKAELYKPSLNLDLPISCDAAVFMNELHIQLKKQKIVFDVKDWRNLCQHWKKKYPLVLSEYCEMEDKINSSYFVDVLSNKLGNDAIVVTDMGTSFTCTMQTFKVKEGQRLFTSSGHASMGFGLPGAIGACFANDRKKTICISGDGALQMNIQELQTIVHYKLPIILFFFNNNKELNAKIESILSEPGPFICEVMMPEDQPLIPRVSSLKRPDGSIMAKPLEDMYPFLPRDEFLENMIIKPVDVLE